MPAVAPVPVPVVVVPADLLGLEMLDLGLRRHGGMKVRIRERLPLIPVKRMRRQRRGLRARAQRGGPGRSGGKSNGELQKVAAFHDIFL